MSTTQTAVKPRRTTAAPAPSNGAALLLPSAADLAEHGGKPARPGPQVNSVVGQIDNPVKFFAEEKHKLLAKLGDLSGERLLLNKVLVAIWVRPAFKDLGGGKRLFHTEEQKNEDVWQGNAGLLVKMGPLAYQDDPGAGVYFGDDKPAVGDWILFRRGEGYRIRINGVECVCLTQERAVHMVLSRPDLVVDK